MTPKIFLLSPASLNGIRARMVTSPRANFEVARQYRSPEGVAIADAFAFMSALYFRGKIAYARHFAVPSPSACASGALVIAPGFGLVPPDWRIDEQKMRKLKRTDVDTSKPSYVRPLHEHAIALASALPPDAQVILLGSVATGKYVDVLHPVFAERLRFPGIFAGLGDMSRGGLMLRAVRENAELEYVSLDAPRHRKGKAE